MEKIECELHYVEISTKTWARHLRSKNIQIKTQTKQSPSEDEGDLGYPRHLRFQKYQKKLCLYFLFLEISIKNYIEYKRHRAIVRKMTRGQRREDVQICEDIRKRHNRNTKARLQNI